MKNLAELHDAAYRLADAFRSGTRTDLAGLKPDKAWAALVKDLQEQCPGFGEAEYASALGRGFFESR